MIPTLQKLNEISRQREGNLQEIPFTVLLYSLAVHERTVVLELQRKQLVKKIVLEFGVPVDCQSNLAHETLGRFMVAKGQLSEGDFTAALSQSAARGVRLGEILVERKLTTPYELYRTLQLNLANKLLDCFTWRDGKFSLQFDVPKVESPLKVKVPQLVITGITRFVPKLEVDGIAGDFIGKRFFVHPSPPNPLEEIRLSGKQQRMVEALKKGARLDELAGQTHLPYVEISRLLYALSLLGIVVEEEDLPKAAPPQVEEKAVITPIATAVEGPALDPEEVERIRNEVMQAYLSYRKQDPFDLLGLGEDVESTEIQRSYIAYTEKFAPARFRQGDLISLLDKARDLFLSGACAYAALIEPEERKRLIARRKRQREEAERKKKEAAADSFKIRTDLLDSEVQYKKGRALAQKGMFQEALRFFEFASDCDPQNGNYRAEKAFALYRVSPLLVKQSLDDLEEALRIDPSCSLAKRYIQEIHQMQGKAR